MSLLTKAQVDRLGERLKQGPVSDTDLRLLDQYRHSFRAAYDAVVATISRELRLPMTGRSAKTVGSIVAKLKRQNIRLSRMQDIAGCRIVVADLKEQEQTVATLRRLFPDAKTQDRREDPSHGYRAVHIIVRTLNMAVEIQVRTQLQDLWAQLSERLSDLLHPGLKYGVGPGEALAFLERGSTLVKRFEEFEKRSEEFERRLAVTEVRPPEALELERGRAALKDELVSEFHKMLREMNRRKGKR